MSLGIPINVRSQLVSQQQSIAQVGAIFKKNCQWADPCITNGRLTFTCTLPAQACVHLPLLRDELGLTLSNPHG